MFGKINRILEIITAENESIAYHGEKIAVKCSEVARLPVKQQCEFVMNTTSCFDELPVYKWLYCDYTGPLISVGILIIVLVMFCLFITITSIADTLVVPCIGTIATTLKMSDTLAGVTVLAFGNGAPDVLTALVSTMMGLPQIFYTALAGGCMFVTTCVTGVILTIGPFQLEGWSLIRDLLFLMISYLILFTCFAFGVVNVHMCITFIALYILYISIVLLSQWGSIRYMKTKMRDSDMTKKEIKRRVETQKSIYSQYPLLRERRFSKVSTIDELLELEESRKSRACQETMWSEFVKAIMPFTAEEWQFMPWHERILNIFEAPVSVMLKLLVPTCNLHAPNDGWSKLLVAINLLFITPAVIYITAPEIHQWALKQIQGVPMYVYLCMPGVIASLMILFLTEVNKPPRGNWILGFIGFAVAIILINNFCQTTVVILEALVTKLDISYSSLAMTLLAWGNSLGDLVSNATLAKNGMPRMGFAACFGAPLFNNKIACIFGGGVTSLVSLIHQDVKETKVEMGLTGGIVTYFVFASLITSFVTFILMDMDGRRSYGYFLLTLYGTFLMMVLGIEFIHKF